jgi:NADPH-dependent glutamate synthase beta subunit-like oxidoreductase
MSPFTITIDGHAVTVNPGQTVLAAARSIGMDIPTLCYLEKCGPLNSCLVCLVKINGKLVPSCGTVAQPGMAVESETSEVHEARRTALELLFSDHVGDCLSPCHRLCPLGLNIPVVLRQIQGGQLAEAALTVRGALPLAGVLGRLCHHPCEQGCRRGNWDDPAAIRDLERFVCDTERREGNTHLPARKPDTGKTVVIVGSGPTGLTAAYQLGRQGHSVTVVDRNARPGGSLRTVPEDSLPAAVLEEETGLLVKMGVQFKLGVRLGEDVSLEGLSRGFDAILVATGEPAKGEAERIGVPSAGTAIKTDPNTCQTPVAKVFAAGAACKPLKQLVRAMAEGRAVAECIHRFLCGQPAEPAGEAVLQHHGPAQPGRVARLPGDRERGRQRQPLRPLRRLQPPRGRRRGFPLPAL